MPFDPNSPFGPADLSQWWRSLTLPRVQSNAPPNGTSGNPGGADGIDDWFVPAPVPNPTGHPNDWIAPWSAETDASYPDDWIYPNSSNLPAPGTTPPAPSPQPSVANPAISNRPAPRPDPFGAYWALIPASRVGAMAWHPPIFPNSLGQFPLPAPAPRDVWPTVGANGLLGGVERMLAERAAAEAAARDPAANGLLGAVGRMVAAREQANNDPWAAAASGRATQMPAWAPTSAPPIDATQGLLEPFVNLQPATPAGQADASYAPASWAFMSPDPTEYQGDSPLPGVILVADKKTNQRNLDLFDGRAFGTTPPLGSAAPRLLPPIPPGGARPSAPQPLAPPTSPTSSPSGLISPPPGQPAISPRPSGTPIGPAPVIAPADESPGSTGTRGGTGATAGGVSSPTPIGEEGRSPASSRPDWQKLTADIRDARGAGPERLQATISAGLPKYDGETTYGVLTTNEGNVVPLQSGERSPLYSNYSSAGHVEGKAAIWTRENDSSGGVLYHNNPGGTCGRCNAQIRTLLPEGARLRVVAPDNAVPKNRWARVRPPEYVGNSAGPKPPPPNPQLDLFNRPQP
jgi:hypothetical protein